MLDRIKELVREEKYAVKLHTRKRMIERDIGIEEVRQAIENGEIIEEYLDDKPLPSCLIYGKTEEGRPIHAVIAVDEDIVAIVTTYQPDEKKWIDYRIRRR